MTYNLGTNNRKRGSKMKKANRKAVIRVAKKEVKRWAAMRPLETSHAFERSQSWESVLINAAQMEK